MGGPVMKKIVIAIVTGTACLFAAAGTYAQESGSGKKLIAAPGSFATLDRNGDHRLSRSEAGFDRVLSQTFAEIDTDGDGFVSAIEFAAADKTRTAASNLGKH